jgi:nitroreductase
MPTAHTSETTLEHTLYAAAARATLAPSLHNTQPWRFVVGAGRLDLFADRSRQATVIDPDARQLIISCGAALFGARLALAAAGFDPVTSLLPDAKDPDHLAAVTVATREPETDQSASRLDELATRRHSNRRRFADAPVADAAIEVLTTAAIVEGASVHVARTFDDRLTIARLTQRADELQNADPAYRAELRTWTTADRERRDGVPASSVPRADGDAQDDVPLRAFDTTGTGQLPSGTHSRLSQTLVVLSTPGDTMRDWLFAGQALHRMLLELTSSGYVAEIMSQTVEVSAVREELRHDLRLSGRPQLLLRAGQAEPTEATPRRPLDDVITFAPARGRQA